MEEELEGKGVVFRLEIKNKLKEEKGLSFLVVLCSNSCLGFEKKGKGGKLRGFEGVFLKRKRDGGKMEKRKYDFKRVLYVREREERVKT